MFVVLMRLPGKSAGYLASLQAVKVVKTRSFVREIHDRGFESVEIMSHGTHALLQRKRECFEGISAVQRH